MIDGHGGEYGIVKSFIEEIRIISELYKEKHVFYIIQYGTKLHSASATRKILGIGQVTWFLNENVILDYD